jgi:hypothetical protein
MIWAPFASNEKFQTSFIEGGVGCFATDGFQQRSTMASRCASMAFTTCAVGGIAGSGSGREPGARGRIDTPTWPRVTRRSGGGRGESAERSSAEEGAEGRDRRPKKTAPREEHAADQDGGGGGEGSLGGHDREGGSALTRRAPAFTLSARPQFVTWT